MNINIQEAISYSHFTTKRPPIAHTPTYFNQIKDHDPPKKLCRKFRDIFPKFHRKRKKRQQAGIAERDTPGRNHTFFKSQPIKGLDRNAIYYYSYAYYWEGTQTFSTAPHSRRHKQYLSLL